MENPGELTPGPPVSQVLSRRSAHGPTHLGEQARAGSSGVGRLSYKEEVGGSTPPPAHVEKDRVTCTMNADKNVYFVFETIACTSGRDCPPGYSCDPQYDECRPYPYE